MYEYIRKFGKFLNKLKYLHENYRCKKIGVLLKAIIKHRPHAYMEPSVCDL